MIELYTAATPNDHKIFIALEELGLEYAVHHLDLGALEQKEPEFLALNPNGRIPAIIDRANNDFTIFESGAILMYLAEKIGKLIPQDEKGRFDTIQWLMFQMSGVGPMQGQANVFFRYMKEKIPVAIERYQNETKRLYTVLEQQLATNEYLVGGELTIADISTCSWVRVHEWAGVDISGLPNLQRWHDQLAKHPAFQKVGETPPTVIPSDDKIKEIQKMLNK